MLKHESLTFQRFRNVQNYRVGRYLYSGSHPLAAEAWPCVNEPVAPAVAFVASYQPVSLGYAWGSEWSTCWFRVRGTVPAAMRGREVVLRFSIGYNGGEGFGGEAQVWRDGKPILALNTHRQVIPVVSQAEGGETFEFFIEAAHNNLGYRAKNTWDKDVPYVPEGPLAERFQLNLCELAVFERDCWDLMHDLTVVIDTIEHTPQDDPRHGQLLYSLNEACNQIADRDYASYREARRILAPLMTKRNGDTRHQISAIGHAHIDTAWLWPLRETVRKCARTFSTALAYMEEYPDYIFACSQAVQYAWMKKHYPDIYAGIQEAFKRGQWEPIGSMWVEPDCNIPSGESLARQLLHGKRFWMEEFGYETQDVWIPDVFGYSASFPQVMKQAGVEWFLTQKISWNQFNRFPHHTFWWEGIDGTRIFTHFPPADTYNGSFSPFELRLSEKKFTEHDRATRSLYAYGFGDGGGGPTKTMLEVAQRVKDFEGLPRVTQEKVIDFFPKAFADAKDPCTWVGELYLELHRGTYTTQSRTKRGNRKGEAALREAEFCDVLDYALHGDVGGASITPQAPERAVYDVHERRDAEARRGRAGALDRAWKLLLLNQFHDIIPGSSIAWVYADNQRDCAAIQALAAQVAADAAAPVVQRIDTRGAEKPLVVLNSLGFARAEVVDTPEGRPLWVAVPSLGHAVADAARAGSVPAGVAPVTVGAAGAAIVLANGLLRLEILADGSLASIRDLAADGREVLAPGQRGNLLQTHRDYPTNWEAWDIDAFHREKATDLPAAESVAVVESSPLRAVVKVVRRFGQSRLEQRIVLRAGSPRIDFDTWVDWQETHQLLKAVFPVDVLAPKATYEIQYGHTERPTHFNTSWDLARFEVCAQKWADLSEGDYGVALLNDCKHGHDIHGNVIRLSLLRAPTDPDPTADKGEHRFTYSLLPHRGDFRQGRVIEEAHALNQPLRLGAAPVQAGNLPASQSWVAVDRPGVYVEGLKVAEDNDALIVRLYEGWGTRGRSRIRFTLPIRSATRADLLERPGEALELKDGVVELTLRPFEIVTLRLLRA